MFCYGAPSTHAIDLAAPARTQEARLLLAAGYVLSPTPSSVGPDPQRIVLESIEHSSRRKQRSAEVSVDREPRGDLDLTTRPKLSLVFVGAGQPDTPALARKEDDDGTV